MIRNPQSESHDYTRRFQRCAVRLPEICSTLSGTTVEEMLADASRATAAGADLVEARLDMLYVKEAVLEPNNTSDSRSKFKRNETSLIPREVLDFDIDEVFSLLKAGIELPVVLTCRPIRQGGHFPGTEDDRCTILKKAIESGVSWIDLEMDIESSVREELVSLAGDKTRIISSEHYDREPESDDEIVDKVREMSNHGDIVKLCYNSNGKRSGLKLFEAAWKLKDEGMDYTVMGIGSSGDWTRIHSPVLGIKIVYTSSEADSRLTSSGRINTTELTNAWQMLDYN